MFVDFLSLLRLLLRALFDLVVRIWGSWRLAVTMTVWVLEWWWRASVEVPLLLLVLLDLREEIHDCVGLVSLRWLKWLLH